METLVLGALKWRMRSITPFSFMPLFISLFKLKDPPLTQALKARAVQILFKAQKGTYPLFIYLLLLTTLTQLTKYYFIFLLQI